MPTFHVRRANWSTEAPRLRQVRLDVFVREQGVPPELECDEFDPISQHVIAEATDGRAIGTGRLLPDGHIGRMAVLREWRKRGVGSTLLLALLAIAQESGLEHVVLHSQAQALGFYVRHGFEPEGEDFLEAGIPHRRMHRHLVRGQHPSARSRRTGAQ